jgi:DNA polymerase I
MTPKPTLFLLDAMALIYRAHFAFSKNPRITSKGLHTSATLGFTNSLIEVITKEKPTHIIVAFDTAAPTWRHATFAAYKAHRQEQPEDITDAIPYVKKILAAFRIPVLSADGYEADDIIGTLARQAEKQGFEVYMMTPDKDFCQLVNEHVYVYKPAYMGNGIAILDKKAVLDKWEISHVDQVRDILALQGDAVDNIPGIPGIGIKTAQKLIQQFGSVEEIIAQVDHLTGKLQDNIRTHAQQGLLSKQLATIHTDVPLQFDLAQSHYQGPDPIALKAIFQELEFNTLARRVLGETIPVGSRLNSQQPAQPTLFEESPSIPSPNEETLSIPSTSSVLPGVVSGFYPDTTVGKATDATHLSTIHTTPHQYHLINTPALRKDLIGYLQLQAAFCFDTETTGLDAHQAQLVGIAFSYYPGEGYYVPIPADQQEAQDMVEEFREVLESPTISKIGQNLKYDQLVLRRYGIEVMSPIFDTMIAHALLAPERPHNINSLAERYLNYKPIPIEELIGYTKSTQKSMRTVELTLIKEYACEDADIALQLKKPLEKAIQQEKLARLCYEVEFPLVQVLAAMEHQGVQVDADLLAAISGQLAIELAQLEEEIHMLAGSSFNLNSPKQLGEILFDKLKIAPSSKKTKTGQHATSELVLADLAHTHPIINKILSYREFQKLKSTYVDALPQLISPLDGRIHTSYNQAVVTTGRLSSINPNLQNIPIRTEKGKAIREAFIPSKPENVLLSADYSQIELRIMASFSQDETMIQAFQAGEDIHAATASKLFKVPLDQVDARMRRQAKTANFGMIYGISAFGLAQRMSISRSEAHELIQAYFQEFHAVKTYMNQIIEQAKAQGYVTTLLGRKRYLRDINSRNATLRGVDERNAINAPIQGTAAEMIKIAMVHIYQWIQQEKLQAKLILQVHDELVFDVPSEEVAILQEQVINLMKNALPLTGVPIEVQTGIGKNWSEAH